MDKKQIVLVALSFGSGKSFTPVQVQKLLFILDRMIPKQVDGPHFNFKPYDYGPFDKDVYCVLSELRAEGLVEIFCDNTVRRYKLTKSGQAKGDEAAASLSSEVGKYIKDVTDFVKRQSFTGLVSAIYRAFPEMKVNSIFR